MQTNSKKLPLVDPPVKTYQCLAYPLSIILAHEEAWPWFYSNFIQLYAINHRDITMHSHGEFDHYPWLTTTVRETGEFADESGLIDLIIASIDEEKYIYLFVDEFYLEHSAAYQQYPFIHDLLIHGYDNERNVVHASGFTKNRTYSCYTVSFASLIKAALTEHCTLHRNVTLLQYKKYRYDNYTYLSHHFDPRDIAAQLEDYLLNRNTFARSRTNHTPNLHMHGIQVYTVVQRHIQRAQQTETMDIRPFHCIYEHKLLMRDRIQFLEKRLHIDLGDLLVLANDLLQAALIMRNMVLKYRMTKDPNILTAIETKIEMIELQEYRLIVRFIDALNQSHALRNNDFHFYGYYDPEADVALWLESLADLYPKKEHHPIIYDVMANLPVASIRKAYTLDQPKTTKGLTIFLESMMSRTWHETHIHWFIDRCGQLLDFIDDAALKAFTLESLRKIAETNNNQQAHEAYVTFTGANSVSNG